MGGVTSNGYGMRIDTHSAKLLDQPCDKGFSLVELSIVLVILGLLVGGIMTGQNLIAAAEKRALIKDVETYKSAFFQFKDKYGHIPGDWPDAPKFWPSLGVGPYRIDGSPGHGDGNGIITTTGGYEDLKVWQEMALAGLITGEYTGIPKAPNPSMDDNELGVNIPRAPLGNAGWVIASHAGNPGASSLFVGGVTPNWQGVPVGFISTEDAYSIDIKLDDGLPSSGIVHSSDGFDGSTSTDCVNGSDAYILSSTGPLCSMRFDIE